MTRRPSGSGLAVLTWCVYGPAVAAPFGWLAVVAYVLVAGPALGWLLVKRPERKS